MPAVLVPGRRVPGGSVAKIGPGIVELEIHGSETIKKDISRGFQPALASLLKRAAFAGNFSVLVRTKIRGSQHTRGLRIGSPETQGVSITWHEGDNGNRIEMLLHRPGDGDVDSFGFHNRLVRAWKAAGEESVVEKVAASESSRMPSMDPPPEKAKANTQKNDHPNAADTSKRYERFVDNADNVQLFMLEIAELALPDGRVMRRACGAVLDKTFGLRTKGNGAIVRSLLNGGFLLPVDEDWLRIPAEWMEKLRPAPVARSAQPSGDFLAQLQQLAAVAETLQAHQSRLEELDGEIAKFDEQINSLNGSRAVLIKERDRIRAQVESPEFAHAAEAFAVIRRLGGS